MGASSPCLSVLASLVPAPQWWAAPGHQDGTEARPGQGEEPQPR